MAKADSKYVFTTYVLALSSPPAQPDQELFNAVWGGLEALLVAELRLRGLWTLPPHYLGIVEGLSWSDGASIEELTAQCYSSIFVDRLRALIAHCRVKSTIDGLVRLGVRHFVHDRQKANDPIGFKTFLVVRSAVERAVARGEYFLLGGSDRICNDSLIAADQNGEGRRLFRHDLRAVVLPWIDGLLPDLVTSRGRGIELLARRLADQLVQLKHRGAIVIRFKDLVDPIKTEVRNRWRTMLDLEHEGSTFVESMRAVGSIEPPASAGDENEAFDQLVTRTSHHLRELCLDARTKHYCDALWTYLVEQAQESSSYKLLSDRKLSSNLGIPRGRVREIYGILEVAMADARSTSFAATDSRSVVGNHE